MHRLRAGLLQRIVIFWLLAALLGPTISGCASRPARPAAVQLAGVVVDGVRLARPDEAGLVTVWREGQRLEGRAGMALRSGDRIDTGPWATAVIRWPSGSELLLRPNGSGVVGSFTSFVGEVFAKIRGAFAVETQFVRAAALGTQYLVRTGAGGETTVIVFDGRVQVDSTTGAWRSVVGEAGSQWLAHPRAPVSQPAAADELARTREWVERIEKLVPPPREGAGSGKAIAVAAAIIALGAIAASSGGRERPPASTAGSPSRPSGEPPAAPPGATSGETPGSLSEASPEPRLCRSALTLAWNAASGARSYNLTIQTRTTRSGWVGGPRSVTATSAQTDPNLDGPLRWQVQAVNAAGTGPASAWRYVQCQMSVLR